MRFGKVWVLLAAIGLIVGMLSACSGSNSANSGGGVPPTGETVMMRWVLPGTAPQDQDEVEKAINDKLKNDGLNLKYKAIYIPWDAWDQKTNLMMSTGEEFEMIHIMYDGKGPNVLASSDGIVPIDDYLDKYGQDLKKSVPSWIWDSAKIDGKTYVIPDFWLDAASSDGMVTMRTDLLKQNGLSAPKTPEELLDAAEEIQKTWPDGGKKPYILPLIEESPVYLHATYDNYPFIVFQNLISVDQTGKVESWLETDAFKRDSAFYREAYQRGLLNPDVLTVPKEVTNADEELGHYLYREGNALGAWANIHQNNPQANLDIYYLNDMKFRPYSLRNANGISATTKHPEAAVQFMNWLYSKQENFDLVLYGIKGEHWEDIGPNKIKVLKTDDTGNATYALPYWMAGNVAMGRWGDDTHPTYAKIQTTVVDDAVNSVTLGFNFDAKSVALEYANCLAELKTSIYPIKLGLVDYDKAFHDALKRMNEAGLQKVVAEYKRQFEAWRAEQHNE